MSVLSGNDFKSKYSTFYKVLNDDLVHNGFQYKLGLNVDPNEFNPSGAGEKGGLHFTDLPLLGLYYWVGPKIGIVEIPDDAKVYIDNPSFKADKLILRRIIEDGNVISGLYKQAEYLRIGFMHS